MTSVKEEGFKSSELLQNINDQLSSNEKIRADAIKKVQSRVAFVVKNNQKKTIIWLLDFKEDGKIVKVGELKSNKDKLKKYDAQIILNDLSLKKLIAGNASAQSLFLSGKLKVKGNVAKATSVESVFKSFPKAKL